MIEENTTIELATHSDASEIAMLSRDLIEQGLSWSWNTERVKKALRDRSTNVAVARDGSNLAGFGIMEYGDKHANLNLLAVKKEYRRTGTGTKIVRWHERVASTAGVFKIYVQVREQNTIAQDFYSKLGYVVLDKVPGYYKHKEVGVIMFRHIGVYRNAT